MPLALKKDTIPFSCRYYTVPSYYHVCVLLTDIYQKVIFNLMPDVFCNV